MRFRWSVWMLATLFVLPLVLPASTAHGGQAEDAPEVLPDDAGALVRDWLTTRQVSDPSEAQQTVAQEGYPHAVDPASRFADYEVREDLAAAGSLAGAQRVMRFAHVTDMQLVDDDAPYPLRQALLDEAFAATISGGAERPQEEYGDEILHSMVDILNAHHALDPLDFAIHTGDNIDNALENELMRYIDLVEGTHTTTGPISGFECAPDGQSESVEDDSNNVEDQCTSLPEHLIEAVRGLAPDMPWYSLNGNHDTLIQGNVNVEPGFQDTAAEFGRRFLYASDYVAMHFADLEPCSGGTEADDFGHGYGYAGDRLCDDDQDNDAYYAFDHRGVRMIALDTVNDEVYETNQNLGGLPVSEVAGEQDFASGVSEGAIDAEQYQWLSDELDTASGQLTFVFAHHTINAFYNRQFDDACGPPGCLNDLLYAAGFIGRQDMQELMTSHPQVAAWIGGHTHEHRVTAQTLEGAESPGYWNIETSGLLDLPQESRIVEVWVTADGSKGFFALDPIGHTFELARELAATDPDHDAEAAEGGPLDQRVLLWFDVPAGISLQAGPQPPVDGPTKALVLEQVAPPLENGSAHVHGEEATSLRLRATDAVTGDPVDGLLVSFVVGSIEYANGTTVMLDQEGAAASGRGNGTYAVQWTFEGDGVHSGRWQAFDPAGEYVPAQVASAFEVEGHAPESDGGFLGIPGPSGFLVALALAGAGLVAVRRGRS